MRTSVNEHGVGWVVKGVEGFAGGEEGAAEGLGLAVRGSVGDDYGVRHFGDEVVADHGCLGCYFSDVVGKRGHKKKPAFGYGGTAVDGFGRSAAQHTAGKAPNNGISPAEKDAQAFLFHRGMETADDGYPLVTELLYEVVGVQDQFAGALD